MQKAWISNISTSSTFTKVPRLEIRRHLDCETDNAVRICPNEIQQKNIVAAVESHYLRQTILAQDCCDVTNAGQNFVSISKLSRALEEGCDS
jgi:hypothetical protein